MVRKAKNSEFAKIATRVERFFLSIYRNATPVGGAYFFRRPHPGQARVGMRISSMASCMTLPREFCSSSVSLLP